MIHILSGGIMAHPPFPRIKITIDPAFNAEATLNALFYLYVEHTVLCGMVAEMYEKVMNVPPQTAAEKWKSSSEFARTNMQAAFARFGTITFHP